MHDLTLAETIRELYISMTAVMFSLALSIIVRMQGARSEKESWNFIRLLYAVMAGNIVSSCSFFAIHVQWDVPPIVVLTLLMLEYGGNIFVCYYFSVYIRTRFSGNGGNPELRTFNRMLAICTILMLCGYYVIHLPRSFQPGFDPLVHGWFRFVVGYGVDLYFIFYAMGVFRERKNLNPRMRSAIVIGFLSTIATMIGQGIVGAFPFIQYLGATLGLFIFYYAVETPDYHKLMSTLEELAKAEQTAKEANQAKSDFLANMSHEIRTPINAVLGMNEMILRESREAEQTASGRQREAVERIISYAGNVESAGKNLLSIINDILDFSKIEAGKFTLSEGEYRLGELLGNVTSMIGYRANAKGLRFDAEVDPKLPDVLYGDVVRVRQIIVNVLNNAVKYTSEGGVRLAVGGNRTNDGRIELRIAVTDSGVGIRQEDIKKLFQKFERVDLGKNNTIEGTGLGLAITQSLLQEMNGTISVASEYGSGSVFSINLPQRIVRDEPIGNYYEKYERGIREAPGYRESFRAPAAHLLIVDDTKMNLTVMESLLEKTMVLMESVTSGEAALTLANDTTYDLIFLDQRMPGMDGIQTLHAIREQEEGKNRETPVICLTADAVVGARERYLAEGFTDYLTKPVEAPALETLLVKYLPQEKVIRVRADSPQEKPTGKAAGEPAEGAGYALPLSAAPGSHGMAAADGQSVLRQTAERREGRIRAFYADTDALDHAAAVRYLGSDALIENTLRQFYEDADRQAGDIEAFFAAEDYENFTIKVHALKSASRMIGATSLSLAAEYLEACGNRATG